MSVYAGILGLSLTQMSNKLWRWLATFIKKLYDLERRTITLALILVPCQVQMELIPGIKLESSAENVKLYGSKLPLTLDDATKDAGIELTTTEID
jgi:hypothetical protein